MTRRSIEPFLFVYLNISVIILSSQYNGALICNSKFNINLIVVSVLNSVSAITTSPYSHGTSLLANAVHFVSVSCAWNYIAYSKLALYR